MKKILHTRRVEMVMTRPTGTVARWMSLFIITVGLTACNGPSTERTTPSSSPVQGPTTLPNTDPAAESSPPPSGFPGPLTPTPEPSGTREQKYLAELRASGVNVSPHGTNELPVADLVCRLRKAGNSDQEIRTQIVAAAGLTGAKNPEELAEMWIKTAQSSYCVG